MRSRARSVAALLSIALTGALAGCAAAGGDGATGQRVVETLTAPDGVPIVYEAAGNGDTALVFIHCWACDRTYWSESVEEFAADYRVVALDLPGHGESGRERSSWTLPGLARDVEAVVEALDLDPVILIGHSMGGPVALEAARRMHDRVLGIACVETLHDAEFRYSPEVMDPVLAQLEADFEGAIESFVRAWFPEGSDSAAVAHVARKARSADPEVMRALLRAFGDIDIAQMMTDAGVPIRCVNAEPRPPMGPATEVETNRRYADFDVVLMEDVGHFPMFERPAELNGHLRWALNEITAVRSSP